MSKTVFVENDSLSELAVKRAEIYRLIRDFFRVHKFIEVETPILVPHIIPESYLTHFRTNLKDRKGLLKKMYLTTSPEASIKKLLSMGLGDCFEITKSFRNGETGSCFHSFEFTILEWYRVGRNYFDIMDDCESLFIHILNNLTTLNSGTKNTTSEIEYQNKRINLKPPWRKLTVKDALLEYADIDFNDLTDNNISFKNEKIFDNGKILKISLKKGYRVDSSNSWEQIFNQIFLNEIEPQLKKNGDPTFLYDYPKPLAALSKLKKDDPRFCERFELYIGGIELADCYSELTEINEQTIRFNNELKQYKRMGFHDLSVDYEFLQAVKKGLPECAGIALGLDRLLMLFLDKTDIKDILFFPI